MFLESTERKYSIDINSSMAQKRFSEILYRMLTSGMEKGFTSLNFVCIGSDRSTGDSLGPLIGYKIKNLQYKNVHVHGTLDEPVHAKNIEKTMERIYRENNKTFIIAIDACLGRMENVGHINIGEGSIKPGSAVKKELMPIGDMYITGIVNFGGFMDFFILQNTRLGLVMKMADVISTGIRHILWEMRDEGCFYC